MAIAKLIAAIPKPVWVLSGDINSPIDWRAPIVIARIIAAGSIKPNNADWPAGDRKLVLEGFCGAAAVIGVISYANSSPDCRINCTPD